MNDQDDFFPPGEGEEDSILNQVFEEAADAPQVVGGINIAAEYQGSVAGSGGQNLGGGALPPKQENVPLHISIAIHATVDTSVVATNGYFGAHQWTAKEEINAR